MTDNDARTSANRLGLWGAGITLPGIVFSSPIAVVLISRLYPQPTWQDARHRPRTFVAVAFTTVFAMLICINHIVQATFVPALVRDGRGHIRLDIVSELTMSHPIALSWAIEMCGIGMLGVATWPLPDDAAQSAASG